MKNLILILLFALTTTNCIKTKETPLLLPIAAEPSAKLHNNKGIEYFNNGKYLEALIQFTQASVADSTTGEIYFNLGLMQHLEGNQEKAKNLFKKARQFANGNKKILGSTLIKKHLDL
jgi:tetratricopeptide (TPR) repeat protein